MQRISKFLVVAAIIAAFSAVPLLAQDASPTIVRPQKVDAKVAGAQIAKPGSYHLNVGNVLDLGYSFSVTPQSMPNQLEFKTLGSGVFDSSKSVIKNVVAPGLMGSGSKAFCFSAVKAGSETITLSIDGNEYTYTITVEGSGNDNSNPELCQGVFSAVQFQGRVYLFANGVHSTSGYRTYFEKAKIAIWPPQFSLKCVKPSGVVAQVLTPFATQASFAADEPVESVVVTDSNGKQTIKVVQFK